MTREPSSLILLHGFGSSFDHNWRQTGWVDILADFGVAVPAIDLPGHGSSSASTDPADYSDIDREVRRALPADGLIAGVGFSAGAELLLRLAAAEPARFDRIVLLGLGDNVFEPGDPAARGGSRQQRGARGRSGSTVLSAGPVCGQRSASALCLPSSAPQIAHRRTAFEAALPRPSCARRPGLGGTCRPVDGGAAFGLVGHARRR